jgi:GDP-L-fucose synthase
VTDTLFELSGKRVWVAGHYGMVGSALVRRLASENCDILTVDRDGVDLTRQDEVEKWMDQNRPDVVIVAAAKVGGILANSTLPADFLYINLAIEGNIIHSAFQTGVEKLLFLGSSCIYPRQSAQPMKEEFFLTGPLEPTNQWYAVAKIAGIKLCEAYREQHGCDFIAAMPTNLFGAGDNFHPEHSHVVAALIARLHKARENGDSEVEIWGSGKPMREFLFVDDCADGLVFMLKNYSGEGFLNVGTGKEISIAEFAQAIADTVGYKGDFVFNTDKPDGMPCKVMDVSKLADMGWRAQTGLLEGLQVAHRWYLEHVHVRT